jgi:hypothetical protein
MVDNVDTMQRLVGYGTNRVKDDFYATPSSATIALIEREKFVGTIWEPACGDGAISKLLLKEGYRVYSTDLIDRGYGDDHFDFLNKYDENFDNIITNPPFKISTKFTLHAIRSAKKKVAIFQKLTFLEGKERRDKLFSLNMLERVYVFSARQGFGNHKGGMLAFAWFVFNKEYTGNPEIIFI